MGRFIALFYGLVCLPSSHLAMLYAIGFISGIAVPKTMDAGTLCRWRRHPMINLFLIFFIFAVQHSMMARRQYEQWLAQFLAAVERSAFCSCKLRRSASFLAMAPDAGAGLADRRSQDRHRGHGRSRSFAGCSRGPARS